MFVIKQILEGLLAWRMDKLLRQFFARRTLGDMGTSIVRMRMDPFLVKAYAHFLTALTLSIAVHSYWPTPTRFFQTYVHARMPQAPLIAQVTCFAFAIWIVLDVLASWGSGDLWRRLRYPAGADSGRPAGRGR
jgi:hypothetical protein